MSAAAGMITSFNPSQNAEPSRSALEAALPACCCTDASDDLSIAVLPSQVSPPCHNRSCSCNPSTWPATRRPGRSTNANTLSSLRAGCGNVCSHSRSRRARRRCYSCLHATRREDSMRISRRRLTPSGACSVIAQRLCVRTLTRCHRLDMTLSGNLPSARPQPVSQTQAS
jgi:hypothetical protein